MGDMMTKTIPVYFAMCYVSGKTESLRGVYKIAGDPGLATTYRGTCPGCGKQHKALRIVRRPLEPSNHVCDARCIHATGQRCECSCGGENHGIGGLGIVVAGKSAQ
jgi:hypothetical protein